MNEDGVGRSASSATGGSATGRGGIRLIRRTRTVSAPRSWPDECAPLFGPVGGGEADARPWQVLGGPGTGKTALVADAAVARMTAAGSDPESVLVLTHSRRAAVDMRREITAGLLGASSAPRATREPLVRTVHSYAFAVLRLQASAYGNPPPRLLTNAEQDSVIREMLRGEVADGAARWPEHVRPALGLVGFASELRDLILRAAERGLGPEDLVAWGRRHSRPEWVAAGRFAAQYEQSMLLRGSVGVETPGATSPGLDAAELVGAALTAFATDPDLLVTERRRIRHVLVDDAQHLDPQAAQLVRLLSAGAASTIVAGDPDQAVFSFRGADAAYLIGLDDGHEGRRIVLSHNHRAVSGVGAVFGAVTAHLPGGVAHRVPTGFRDDPRSPTLEPAREAPRAVPPVRVVVATSTAKEATAIADTFRRAHLADGVPWSQMAIIVRSVPRSLPPLRRALHAAGVPVVSSATAVPLHRHRGASALLLAMRAAAAGRPTPNRAGPEFGEDEALALIEGPLGAADPLAVRRLRRGLRRGDVAAGGERDSSILVRDAIVGTTVDHLVEDLTDVERAPLMRVRAVVRAISRAVGESGRRVEDALWAGWQATRLERRWVAASARGGPLGVQADRDLDSVVALFDAAASYVDALPRGTLEGFVEYVTDQEVPVGDGRRSDVTPDAVSVLSAHAAVGREWDVVAVAGVQEGLWPALRPRGSLLGVEALVDLAAGVSDGGRDLDDRVSRTAPLLAEERRLFLVACSRARSSLVVSAVDSVTGTDTVRSRFVDDVLASGAARRSDGTDGEQDSGATSGVGRVLALPALVAELRSVVCDARAAESDPERRARAARHLARLARSGVPGAHPDEWYGISGPSTDAPLWDPADGPVALSPSTVEVLTACPLRWALERGGGTDGDTVHAVTGTLVHTLVQAVAGRVPPDEVRRELDKAWVAVDLGSAWFSRKELGRTAAMIETFQNWMSRSRGELTEAGVEVPVEGVLEPRTDDEPAVLLRGRIDRLERDPDGRPVVVDVKTGKNPATAAATAEHAQLATYQVALSAGAVEGEPPGEPGGGRLVYVAKPHRSTGATERTQAPLNGETLDEWRDVVVNAARATRGPTFEARVNDGCRHCPIASSCPAQDRGRQVTEG